MEALEDFVLSKIKVDIKEISLNDWESFHDKQQWLLFLCGIDSVNCPERKTMMKLASSLVIYFVFFLLGMLNRYFTGRFNNHRNCKRWRVVRKIIA